MLTKLLPTCNLRINFITLECKKKTHTNKPGAFSAACLTFHIVSQSLEPVNKVKFYIQIKLCKTKKKREKERQKKTECCSFRPIKKRKEK